MAIRLRKIMAIKLKKMVAIKPKALVFTNSQWYSKRKKSGKDNAINYYMIRRVYFYVSI